MAGVGSSASLGFVDKFKMAVLKPLELFQLVKNEEVKDSLVFYGVLALVSAVANSLTAFNAFLIVAGFAVMMAGLLVGSFIVQFVLEKQGGAKGSYANTLAVMAYSWPAYFAVSIASAVVLGVLGFVLGRNSLAGGIVIGLVGLVFAAVGLAAGLWVLYSQVKGLMAAHEVEFTKVAIAYAVLIVIGMIFGMVVGGVLFLTAITAA